MTGLIIRAVTIGAELPLMLLANWWFSYNEYSLLTMPFKAGERTELENTEFVYHLHKIDNTSELFGLLKHLVGTL